MRCVQIDSTFVLPNRVNTSTYMSMVSLYQIKNQHLEFKIILLFILLFFKKPKLVLETRLCVFLDFFPLYISTLIFLIPTIAFSISIVHILHIYVPNIYLLYIFFFSNFTKKKKKCLQHWQNQLKIIIKV